MKNIFNRKRERTYIKLDPFFIELAIILPVFAICCCAVLKMLAVSSERAVAEEARAAAITLAGSYCDVYGECGDMELAAKEIFGNVPEEILSRNDVYFSADLAGVFSESSEHLTVHLTERWEDISRDGVIYGRMMYSDITVFSEYSSTDLSSCCYKPMAAPVISEKEEGHE